MLYHSFSGVYLIDPAAQFVPPSHFSLSGTKAAHHIINISQI